MRRGEEGQRSKKNGEEAGERKRTQTKFNIREILRANVSLSLNKSKKKNIFV